MEREALKLAFEALGKAKRQIVHAKVAPHGCIGDAITAIKEALAQPAQERQWLWLSDADIAEVIDTTCQYTGGYEEYLIKKAERKIRSMNNGT